MAVNSHPNSVSAQRARILDRLRQGPVTTLEARSELDILHPAARVMELRGQGYQIKTFWSLEPSLCGQMHRVARYILIPSGDGASMPMAHRMSASSARRGAP